MLKARGATPDFHQFFHLSSGKSSQQESYPAVPVWGTIPLDGGSTGRIYGNTYSSAGRGEATRVEALNLIKNRTTSQQEIKSGKNAGGIYMEVCE